MLRLILYREQLEIVVVVLINGDYMYYVNFIVRESQQKFSLMSFSFRGQGNITQPHQNKCIRIVDVTKN